MHVESMSRHVNLANRLWAQVREKVDAGAVTLDKFVIHKQLTKRPEDYPDAKNQPHVQVALRRAAAHKRDGTKQVHFALQTHPINLAESPLALLQGGRPPLCLSLQDNSLRQ